MAHKFSFSNVSYSAARWQFSSNLQSTSIESISATKEIPINQSIKSSKLSPEGRLHGQAGCVSGVLPHPREEKSPKISEPIVQRSGLQLHLSSLRSSECATGIFQSKQLGGKFFLSAGDEGAGLPGGLPICPSGQGYPARADR